VRLSNKKNGGISTCQFAYQKGLGTCDALFSILKVLQMYLDRGWEASLVALDFSAAFDRIGHATSIHMLQAVGVGERLLLVLRKFLTNRTMKVTVDGLSSDTVDVVSGVS